MKISITFGVAVLALAAVATSCATVSGPRGGVYLVGVAGGG